MTATLRVDRLSKAFGGITALDGIDLAVAAGEVVALIGPNGAGKSTCFNVVHGQLKPDRGRVYLEEKEVTGLSPRRMWQRGVGRTFQIASAFASMSVVENVQTALLSYNRRHYDLWRRARAQYLDEAQRLVEEVGLGPEAGRVCGTLSYGSLKLVELAMVLAHRPRVLLMDEPTAGMAMDERATLMSLATRLARTQDLAILFTEHDMEVVFGHADRIVVLDRGRTIADGSPSAVAADPKVREIYLGDGRTQGSVPC